MTFLTFMRDFGGLLFTSVLILIYTIILVVKLINKKKMKGKLTLLDIYEEIPRVVASAEKMFGAGKGEAKLDHVLKTLRLDAMDSGLSLDIAKATKMINDVVDTTKIVNVKGGVNLATPIDNSEANS